MSDQDTIFMKNFAIVLAGMAIFTIGISILAYLLNDQANRPDDPTRDTRVTERLTPAGGVYAGDTGRAQLEAAALNEVREVAFDGSLDGNLIYGAVCQTCHGAGIAGAPQLLAAEWTDRIAQGMETLNGHAIQGYTGPNGYMPPKGGRLDLSDEQVRATVEWMVANLE